MGVAVYPRIENTNADWVQEISGKSLARGMERLFELVKKQGYKDLMSYYVPSQEDMDDWQVDEKAEMVWYNPMEGLTLIEAMTRAFHGHRDEFEYPDQLEEDLSCFRKILDRAASQGMKWNLGMSY
ncbi:MAG: hypothetical protein JWM68_292 [Verrucomicrobiales bacterium]|nr:hypothetical protein [Verrucomicrobiales bacterium]